jgi:hypothetical protein
MRKIFNCRRSSLALIGMAICGAGLYHGMDTSPAIAAICIGVAGANAYQGKKSK